MNIKKIFKNLPSYPHYRMNVFSGTNKISDIINILNYKFRHDNYIKKYQEIISYTINSENIFTFASGRMGFYTILKSINIKKNEEVIIPSFTCVVVPNAILYSGAKPIYCDIRDDDFNIDVSKLEELITPKTKVLYAQHTFGQMCDITAIKKISDKYNLIVVEDCAGALGAKLNNVYAGTIGDFGYFSTDRTKVINTGLGGIVSVNNKKFLKIFNEIYDDTPYLSNHLSKKLTKTFILNFFTLNPHVYWVGKFINDVLSKFNMMTYLVDEPFTKKERIKDYPYPARLSAIFANIGFYQFKKLNDNLENRRKIAKYYNEILKIYSDEYMQNTQNIFLRYSFLVKNRDLWEKKFSSKIDLSIWFKTIAFGRNEKFEEINYKANSNKVSEYVCKHIFNLPTHNQIKAEKLKTLLKELKNSSDLITKDKIL